MKKLKTISQNSLEELLSLMEQVENKIQQYSHVSEYLPKSIVNELGKFYEKLQKEYNHRLD